MLFGKFISTLKAVFTTYSNGSPADGEHWYNGTNHLFHEDSTSKKITSVTAGTIDNVALRADGTGGFTSQGSAIVVTDYTTSTQNNVAIKADDGAATDITLVLSSKGVGAISARIPNGATSGGNARGSNAVDWTSSASSAGADYVASGAASAVGGGANCKASGSYSTISGGNSQVASGDYSTISGGNDSLASGNYSSVGGGDSNVASGVYSSIQGGYNATAGGLCSAVIGGADNSAMGDLSVSSGRGLTLTADADYTFGFHANTGGSLPMTIQAPNVFVTGNSDFWLANNDNTARAIKFFEPYNASGNFPNTANSVALKAGTLTADTTYTLPTDYPASSGYALVSTTGGVMSWSGAGAGDMILASVQTNSGAKTYLDATFKLRNVANTFDGVFTNTNTANRTYTLQNAAGTIAFTSDITGVNSGTNTGDQTLGSLGAAASGANTDITSVSRSVLLGILTPTDSLTVPTNRFDTAVGFYSITGSLNLTLQGNSKFYII